MPRPLKVDDDTLRTLEQRLAKAKNDLARARAAQEDQARRLDARRKIIAGAIALEHFEKMPVRSGAKSTSGSSMKTCFPRIGTCSGFSPCGMSPLPRRDRSSGVTTPSRRCYRKHTPARPCPMAEVEHWKIVMPFGSLIIVRPT